MTYTAAQRKREGARQRALARQTEKVRHAVPEGFRRAPVDAVAVPLGRYSHADLAQLVGVEDLAGFVLAASCFTQVCIYGASYPRFTSTRAWSAGAYLTKPGDRIEFACAGRGSIGVRLVKLSPLVRGASPVPLPVGLLDANGLPCEELPPPPWEVNTGAA
jgi:hypothetical protein